MAGGLIALLDDVAGLTRLAAASLDDVAGAAAKAGTKAAGVVVDDTAVTPRYVMGLSPQRELPIIGKIALGSLRNKILILLPIALLLSAFAPWAITPLLMIGGAYLCFEGAEKVVEVFAGHESDAEEEAVSDPVELENQKVSGAIRTDFILSAEIMAIALGEVSDAALLTQAITLIVVALAITAGVYGVVALIVKLDDIGLHMAQRRNGAVQATGRGLVKSVPVLMQALAVVGTAAMIWVGGQIFLHGLEVLGLRAPMEAVHHASEATAHAVPALAGVLAWIVNAALCGVFGLLLGGVLAAIVHRVQVMRGRH